MHILVTNDDGPPSAASSPYILPFVSHLIAAGHRVSICIPSTQRSWIAKAHLVGQSLTATRYTPPAYQFPPSSPPPYINPISSLDPSPASTGINLADAAEWFLVDSTPASCAQLGLHHLFSDIDLVVSGPNYGRNTTAVFALSSGTLGGALEATVAGYKSIALSYAFFDRNNDPNIVAAACRHAVKVVEYLASAPGWEAHDGLRQVGPSPGQKGGNEAGVVYSVNIPLVKDVETAGTVWTRMLANRWDSSCFAETAGTAGEKDVRKGEVDGSRGPETQKGSRHFTWAPQFGDVYTSVERAGPGSDGWAVSKGQTSVTMLRANFEHVDIEGRTGEVKL